MLRRVSKLLAVSVLLLCCLGRGQDIRIDVPYQKFVLSNGLTVIVHEDRKAPIMAVNEWYHVGSKPAFPI